MAVCQYFLQGWCKFGQNCRNEHINQQVPRINPRDSEKTRYDDLILETISAERGKQWPLSSFAPFRDWSPIPNLNDTSPDELRCTYYDAKRIGPPAIESYITFVKQLMKNAEDVRNFLKRPSPELTAMLSNISTKKPDSSATNQSAVKTSFRFDVGHQQQTNVFGGSSTNNSGTIFGGAPMQNPGTINQSSGSIFGSAPTGNIFGSTAFPTAGPFTKPTPETNANLSVFGGTTSHVIPTPENQQLFSNVNQNIFGSAPMPPNNQNLFKQANVNIFGGAQPVPPTADVRNISREAYSNLEDLSEEDRKTFEASVFTFGKIPLRPPSENYC